MKYGLSAVVLFVAASLLFAGCSHNTNMAQQQSEWQEAVDMVQGHYVRMGSNVASELQLLGWAIASENDEAVLKELATLKQEGENLKVALGEHSANIKNIEPDDFSAVAYGSLAAQDRLNERAYRLKTLPLIMAYVETAKERKDQHAPAAEKMRAQLDDAAKNDLNVDEDESPRAIVADCGQRCYSRLIGDVDKVLLTVDRTMRFAPSDKQSRLDAIVKRGRLLKRELEKRRLAYDGSGIKLPMFFQAPRDQEKVRKFEDSYIEIADITVSPMREYVISQADDPQTPEIAKLQSSLEEIAVRRREYHRDCGQ